MSTADQLVDELEKQFELDEMTSMAEELLGLDPERLGGTGGKAAFARALTNHCKGEQALEALADAIAFRSPNSAERVRAALLEADTEVFKPGTKLEGFRVLKRLGAGPLGTVYLAERKAPDNGHTERAALKVFHSVHTRDRTTYWRFLTTARALRSVQDTGLANVYGVGTLADGRAWVAVEHVAGQTLAGRLSRTGALHFNELRPVARALLRGLSALHDHGLVHGNLKAENVYLVRPPMVEGEARPQPYGVLVDAGTHRLLEHAGDAAEGDVLRLVGNPSTLAPEVARGQALDARAEIYAVGALLYEALAGRPPFSGDSPIEIVAAHLSRTPEPPSAHAPRNWVPEQLDRTILRAMATDPAERFATAAQFADALEEVGRSQFPSATKQAVDMEQLLRTAAALTERPGDEELANSLEALVAPTRDWQLAVDAFMEAIDANDDPALKLILLFRTARILESEMRDPQGAERVYTVVLQLDPSNAQAQNAISEARRAGGDFDGLVELLLDRLQTEAEAPARAAILREVATVYEESLDNPQGALVAWGQAVIEDPDHERSVAAVQRLARTEEQWAEVVGSLQQALGEEVEPPLRALQLHVVLGRWYAARLSRPDYAVHHLNQALQLDPAHEPALEALTNIYRSAQSWNELVSMLLHRADAASSPTSARDLRAEAAGVLRGKIGDMARAEELFTQIFADDPAHPGATAALEEIYAAAEDWRALAELLQGRAGEQRGPERVATLCQLAELFEDRIDDLDEARRRYNTVLALDDTNLIALKGLERIHARNGDYAQLQGNLERQLELAASPNQRIGLLERIAAILEEELADTSAAVDRYEQIIEIAPGNDRANTALSRLYRELQRFDELAQTLDRHAKSVEDRPRKVSLLMHAARVLMGDVGSPDRAAFVCERVVGLSPDHPEALELLARIRSLGGDTMAALDALEVLADTEQEPRKRAELWVKAASVLEQREDLDAAVDRYELALDALPNYEPAHAGLQAVYERRGDAQGQGQLLARQAEQAETEADKAALLVRLGQLQLERLKAPHLAEDSFERARLLAPDSPAANVGLGLLAIDRKRWAQASELLNPWVEQVGKLEAALGIKVCVGAGDALVGLDDTTGAQRAYLRAKSLAPGDRTVTERLADLAVLNEVWDEAAALLQEVLEQHGKTLGAPERTQLLLDLGRAQHKQGEMEAAMRSLTLACKNAPESSAPLNALRAVQRDLQRWDAVARSLAKGIELAGSDDERFELFMEAGDVYATHLKDRRRAGSAYVAALELRADDRNLLTKLMGLYSQNKDWSKLVDVLHRMTEVVDDTRLMAKYLHTAGTIAQREMRNYDAAIADYERALRFDAGLEAAFSGLTECLARTANWKGLARAYRSQIDAVQRSADSEVLGSLWDELAQLYHRRLDDVPHAAEAYEAAQKHDPKNRRRLESMVELYSKQPHSYGEQAIAAHAALIEHNPYRVESYQDLRRLYTQLQRPDEAWCVCQTLRELNMAGPEEAAFFRRHRTSKPATARECVTEQLWPSIVHPEQDSLVTHIFSLLTPAAVASLGQPPASLGIDPSQQVDPGSHGAVMPQMLHYTAGVMLIAIPPVFVRPQDPGGVSFLFSAPPSLSLGAGALRPAPDQALAFIAARQLSYFRPGHFMRQLAPTGSALRAWLLSAVRIGNTRFPIPDALAPQVDTCFQAVRDNLTGPQQQGLTSLADRLLKDAPELDMKRWAAAVDLTADRVGFLLSNSLEASVAVVRASPADSSAVAERDRLKGLHTYSVSPEYLNLRRSLGIKIE